MGFEQRLTGEEEHHPISKLFREHFRRPEYANVDWSFGGDGDDGEVILAVLDGLFENVSPATMAHLVDDMKGAPSAKHTLTADTYKVLRRAVEDGFDYGYQRAHKHIENPNQVILKQEVEAAIMNEVCEYFSFPEP